MTRRGWTLVEVVIISLVLSVVGGAMLVMAQMSDQIWGRTDVRLTTILNAQRALNRVREDLRKASQASLLPAGNCTAATLRFTQPSTGDTITYTLAGNDLTRQIGVAAPVTVASELTAFTPSCQGGGLVRLNLTSQASSTAGGSALQTLETQIWVREP